MRGVALLTISILSLLGCDQVEKDLRKLGRRLPQLVLTSLADVKNDIAPPASYIVTFKVQTSGDSLYFANFWQETQTFYGALYSEFHTDLRVRRIQFLSSVDLNDPKTLPLEEQLFPPDELQLAWSGADRSAIGAIARIDFASHAAAHTTLKEWQAAGKIWFAEPNYYNQLSGVFGTYKEAYDEASSSIDWLSAVRVTDAFATLDGVESADQDSPIIAVMDSGIQLDHPGLSDNLWQNSNTGGLLCGGEDEHGCNTTAAGNGKLGDSNIAPFNVGDDGVCPQKDGECESSCCHGTHVAGILAGKLDSGESSGGICPTCKILTIRIYGTNPFKNDGSGTIIDSSIIAGLKYIQSITKEGSKSLAVRVINASFGKFQRSRATGVLVRSLTQGGSGRGALVIGAAGNEDSNKMTYPGAFTDAIAVANLDENDEKAVSSNFGRWVDIAAPGQNIISTVPGSDYELKSGTSMAAPVVSGIAGLIVAADPNISTNALRNRLLEGADPEIYTNTVNQAYLRIPQSGGLPVPLLGSGRVDALNAVEGKATSGRPAVSASERVREGCATLGHRRSPGGSLLLWLLLPLVVVLGRISGHRYSL